MNTEITVHPKLQHLGLTTGNLDAMVDWYSKVLGMTVNHRSARSILGGMRANSCGSSGSQQVVVIGGCGLAWGRGRFKTCNSRTDSMLDRVRAPHVV
jgi:hypothetical protein